LYKQFDDVVKLPKKDQGRSLPSGKYDTATSDRCGLTDEVWHFYTTLTVYCANQMSIDVLIF
jgi:hypothetical protein